MAEEDQSQKTEQPTTKRLSDARNRGQVAVSQEVKSWAILLAGAFGLVMLAPGIMSAVERVSRVFLEQPHAIPLDFEHQRHLFTSLFLDIGLILAPLLGLFVATAIIVNLGQVGWNVSSEKIKFRPDRLSPVAGAKRVFGPRALVQFVKGVLKVAIVSSVAIFLVTPLVHDIELIPQMEIVRSLDRMHVIAIRLALGTVAVMTIVAALDYMYQKYDHIKQLKMTKQEVKDEYRQQEGDPKVKQQLAKIRTERARARMMAAVPNADVVITNPTHFAVALEYKMESMPAPKLVAKGVDTLAQRIREVAEENEIPIVENAPLARALYSAVDLNEEIPPEHYVAVAEVIGYVFRLKGKIGNSMQGVGNTRARGNRVDIG
jgi:flagellar biosynthetic protein FlhB